MTTSSSPIWRLPRSNSAKPKRLLPDRMIGVLWASTGPCSMLPITPRKLRPDGLGKCDVSATFVVTVLASGSEPSLPPHPPPSTIAANSAAPASGMRHRFAALQAIPIPRRTVAEASCGTCRLELGPIMVRRVRLPLANRIETAAVLVQRGLLRPVRPDRLVRMGLAFNHWGVSVAAAFAVNAISRPNQAAIVDDDALLTYGEVDQRTNALANELARLGVG